MPETITLNNVENNDVFLQPGESFIVAIFSSCRGGHCRGVSQTASAGGRL